MSQNAWGCILPAVLTGLPYGAAATNPVIRPVYRAVAMANRCACQRRWLSINVEMKK
jgi:hypothetical protein